MSDSNDPTQDVQQPGGNQINIELPEDQAEGVYSNLVMIAHSPEEFILDFIRVMPGGPKARVKSRVIVTPQHAKRLLRALSENIERYERASGIEFVHREFYVVLALYMLAAVCEMFYARYLNGNSEDDLYPRMETLVPDIAGRAKGLIDGDRTV